MPILSSPLDSALCLLCINGYSQITNAYNRYYTPSEYNALYEQLDGMSLQEANAFVSAKIEAASPDSDADYNGYLYYDTLEIIEGLQNYPAYLESIQTNAENMTAVSIWCGTDTFSYRNIQKRHPPIQPLLEPHWFWIPLLA